MATNFVLEYELPTLLLTSELCFSFRFWWGRIIGGTYSTCQQSSTRGPNFQWHRYHRVWLYRIPPLCADWKIGQFFFSSALYSLLCEHINYGTKAISMHNYYNWIELAREMGLDLDHSAPYFLDNLCQILSDVSWDTETKSIVSYSWSHNDVVNPCVLVIISSIHSYSPHSCKFGQTDSSNLTKWIRLCTPGTVHVL